MTNPARDLRYGRQAGRWAEDWSDDDEARYQAALTARNTDTDEPDQPSLFDQDEDGQ